MDGVEATRLIAESGSPSRIVNLTTFDLDAHVVDALRAGVSGFLVKDGPADSLVGAIRTGADGEAVLSPRVTHRLLDRFAHLAAPATANIPSRLDALTSRELDVLRPLTSASPTPRSPSNREWGRPRSRRTSRTSWRSTGYGTGCRP